MNIEHSTSTSKFRQYTIFIRILYVSVNIIRKFIIGSGSFISQNIAKINFFAWLYLLHVVFQCISAWLNKTRIYNDTLLSKLIDSKPRNVPLLTLSNHHSCFDDPGIWGKLKPEYLFIQVIM